MSIKRRNRLQIIHDMVLLVSTYKELGPTRFLSKSNLSPQLFKSYLQELLDKGFVGFTLKKDRKVFFLLPKGYDFLLEFKTLERFIDNFGL